MAIDITALYCCLDDFCKVFEDWEAHRLIPSQTTRQRTGKGDRRKVGGQAATAIGGCGSLVGRNFCPKPVPSVPL